MTVCAAANAAGHSFRSFDNLDGKTSHLCIRDITQTADGMMWFATGSGLYSYDGYHLTEYKYPDGNGEMQGTIPDSYNCIMECGDSLVLGYNSGVMSFCIHTGTFRILPYANGEIVCGIKKSDGQMLWVATDKGLYCNGQILPIHIDGTIGIGCKDDLIYIGRIQGVSRYSTATCSMESLADDIRYAACISCDNRQLWVGSATAVTLIDTASGEKKFSIPVPVAKCLLQMADGRLLVGTDDGLYITSQNETRTERITHDARFSNSLAGNAVWSIYEDRDGNIWIGTDNGISLMKADGAMTVYPLPTITEHGSGNRLTTVFSDSQGRFWLGGASGLLCVENLDTERQTSRWYRMNDNKYAIRHNHVRCIMETRAGKIVVGGDMGLMIYNEKTQQFETMELDTNDAGWIYDIEETPTGDMLLTTFTATYTASPDYERHRVTVNSRHKRKDLSENVHAVDRLLRRYGMDDRVLSAYHDDTMGITLLGGNDFFALIKKSENMRISRTPAFTDVRVNGKERILITRNDGDDRMFAELPDDAVFVEVMFSDFDYSRLTTDMFQYRLDSGGWLPMRTADCIVMLTELSAGKHVLTVRNMRNINAQAAITLYVKPLWYVSPVAKILYVLLGCLLAYMTWPFIGQRRRLKRKRIMRQILTKRTHETELRMMNENKYLSTRLRIQQHEENNRNAELSVDEKFLIDITAIIKDNMADAEFNVDSLCRLSNTGSKQLYRKIKALTGLTTVAYIRSLRIQKAAALLAKGTMTVSEVMYTVGFSSPSYFTKCFQEEYGVAPSEYRLREEFTHKFI